MRASSPRLQQLRLFNGDGASGSLEAAMAAQPPTFATVDTAPGQGARNQGGFTRAPALPGIGVEPDVAVLGEPVAVYG